MYRKNNSANSVAAASVSGRVAGSSKKRTRANRNNARAADMKRPSLAASTAADAVADFSGFENHGAKVRYLAIVGGDSMNLEDLPVTEDGQPDEARMKRVIAVVQGWHEHFKPVKKELSSRKVRGYRVMIPDYDVTDMTMHVTTEAPMRLMIRNIDRNFPNWATKRKEFLAFAQMTVGDMFGDHVSIDKSTPQRRSIPIHMNDLYGIVPDWRRKDGTSIPVSLDDEMQRNILPYLEVAARAAPFCLLKASIFVDPPGSVSQVFHEDVPEFDRVQLWNLFLPIQAAPGVHTASMKRNHESGVVRLISGENDAIMWDGHWSHQGVGNTSKVTRVMLHLVYAQVWVTQSKVGKKALGDEYNRKQSIEDPSTPVGYWLDRYMKGASV